ncbi:MAG: hypothetical protein DWG76_02805 [Chloroflexi bacterium]|nr:LysM peptidoglycan-binding domain-containing protein [Chloroflexota bacterium]MQC26363.1 hypothetical protein [Chloroflexota bacterium]
MTKKLTWAAALIVFILLWAVRLPVSAAPQLQSTPLPTPTAGADGRILYVVQLNDSPFLIAAKFQIDINQLRILNNWASDEILLEGQTILLGLATEQEPTPTPTPQTEVTPEGTPEAPGTGTICVLLFNDVNGDALRQETEFGIDSGAVSVSERSGLASQTGTSFNILDVDGEPITTCFNDLPLGEYTVSVAAPEGYNPTTAQSAPLQLAAGDETTLNFGAQLSSGAQSNQLSPQEGGRSPLLGLLGIVLLLSGLGLGAYTWQIARRS